MKMIAFPALALLLLTGCSQGGKQPASEKAVTSLGHVGDPCRYGKRPKNVYVAVRHRNGLAYKGDMKSEDIEKLRSKWGAGTPRRVVTATAAPKIGVWTISVAANCYNPKQKAYYNCTKELRTDLTEIRAMVRAVRRPDARRLAVLLCQQRVLAKVSKQTKVRLDHRKLRCHIIDDRWCPLPKGPPAKKAGKKAGKKSN